MPDHPLAGSPYEVLGVSPTASTHELRKAYRRMLRITHPDTGGNAARFHAVQRAWEKVGTPEARARYDRGATVSEETPAWAPPAPRKREGTRPTARAYGHPGGASRERYLELVREWAGRGVTLDDPYDPQLVRRAPRDIRHLLANALAEEQTARTLAGLGIGYTIWHDVATEYGKLDHVVLGPTGLFALQSEDWGAEVRTKRGELIGEGIVGERPMHDLGAKAKQVARAARVKFTALLVVVPDAATYDGVHVLGSSRGAVTAVVQQPRLTQVLRDGLPGAHRIGGTDLFEVRTRLQATIRFV